MAEMLKSLLAKPGHLIRRSQQIAVAIFMDETADFDITPVQYAALLAVSEFPDIDVARLSDLVALDRSTLGNVVERLEIKGWLERRPADTDKRSKLLRLTSAGRTLLKAVSPGVQRAQLRILSPVPKADRERFVSLLKLVVDLNNDQSRAPSRPVRKQR